MIDSSGGSDDNVGPAVKAFVNAAVQQSVESYVDEKLGKVFLTSVIMLFHKRADPLS